MKPTLPNLKDLARRWPPGRSQPRAVESEEETVAGTGRRTQAAAGPLSLFFMLSHLEGRRAGPPGRGEAGGAGGDGAGTGRAQAGRLRRFPERPGLPGATAGAPAPAGAFHRSATT